jgi:formylglycine-generating enzyme required for sulfatase activity
LEIVAVPAGFFQFLSGRMPEVRTGGNACVPLACVNQATQYGWVKKADPEARMRGNAAATARSIALKTAPWVVLVLAALAITWAVKARNAARQELDNKIDRGPALPAFKPTVENRAPPPGPAPEKMVWIPGGEFSMGTEDPRGRVCGGDDPMPDARPIHRVKVDGFWMDITEVTNAQFARFVDATGYVTIAERTPTKEEFPDAPPENLVAGSTVFTPTDGPVPLDNHFRWWRYEKGASWRHPDGPASTIDGRGGYPVVHVAYDDAAAYAKWAGKRLPTEAEFEFAERGGITGAPYSWGGELKSGGKWMCNAYQGEFPFRDAAEDGFAGVAPVAQFPPNRYGLYDISGNVWEWCSDWYRPDYFEECAARGVVENPPGPNASLDPAEPDQPKRVHRGGSFLCTDEYCARYMAGTRGKGEITTSSNHLGFRCVRAAR